MTNWPVIFFGWCMIGVGAINLFHFKMKRSHDPAFWLLNGWLFFLGWALALAWVATMAYLQQTNP